MPRLDERQRFRPMAMAALCFAAGGGPLLADAPSQGSSLVESLNTPASWAQFKDFWAQVDGGKGFLFHLTGELAQRFGMGEASFQEALRQTEGLATGVPPSGPALALKDYALASLARFRLDASTLEPRLRYTRMAVPPPSTHVARQLQEMEIVERRLDELSDLQRRNAIPPDSFLQAVEGIHREVYHHCVLKAAALAHARVHRAVEAPAGMQDSEDYARIMTFYLHPETSPIGSPAWFQRYDAAMLRLMEAAEKATDPTLRSQAITLRQRHQALVASLKRLDAFKPRLEALFADLEQPVGP
jgi:hypothetical protein